MAVTLSGGRSVYLPGKSWSTVSPADEGAEDLIAYLKKGFLVRFEHDTELAPVGSPDDTVIKPALVSLVVESVKPDVASSADSATKMESEEAPLAAEVPAATSGASSSVPVEGEEPSVNDKTFETSSRRRRG